MKFTKGAFAVNVPTATGLTATQTKAISGLTEHLGGCYESVAPVLANIPAAQEGLVEAAWTDILKGQAVLNSVIQNVKGTF